VPKRKLAARPARVPDAVQRERTKIVTIDPVNARALVVHR
jgi:hypothetical protein